MRRAWVRAGLVGLALTAAASAGAAPPRVHAITGARIVVAPGRVVEAGTVVIRDGVIAAAGADAAPPPDARLWEGEGLTVYPGLIEPFSARPWPAPPAGEGAPAPRGGHANPLVNPERDMAFHAADEAATKKLRQAGFTTALVVPREGLLRGRAALVNLGDGEVSDNLLRRQVAQVAGFASNTFDGAYPVSLLGSVALFRQVLIDAAWYRDAQAAYRRNPAQERPPLNLSYDALVRVVEGADPLIFETADLLGTLRAAALIDDLDLNAYLVGNGEEYRRLEAVRATGLPHLVPAAFPKPPAAAGADDLAVGLEELVHWDRAPENPQLLLAAGVTVALTTHGLADPGQLYPNLARSLERGLTAEQALAALTTTPAALLGIADRAGTVEPGKMANLLEVEGELFVDKPKIRAVWVDGRRYELQELKPPEVDPVGRWEVMVDAGDQQIPVALAISGEIGALRGTLGVMGNTLPLTTVEVSAKTLLVAFDGTPLGIPGEIRFEMEIEGDAASGRGDSPDGPFTLTATRIGRPPPEVTP